MITHDVIKIMYKRDNVHAKAIKRNDHLSLQHYRVLRNKVICVIKERKNAYLVIWTSFAQMIRKECGKI